jgi:septum formation protein
MMLASGVKFNVVPATIDEAAVKTERLSAGCQPDEIVRHLAEIKAVAVSSRRPDAIVIGADQILVLEGRIIDKSTNLQSARILLRRLSGQTHRLITAVAVAQAGQTVWHHSDTSELTMRRFTDNFLDRYLTDEGEAILDAVGCYKLEGAGIQLFDLIVGDYFAILGLPLLPLIAALRELGALQR